jgi:hypothetical protein
LSEPTSPLKQGQRLFIVAILVTLVLQVFFFLSLPDDQRELFIESFDQTLRRAREGK